MKKLTLAMAAVAVAAGAAAVPWYLGWHTEQRFVRALAEAPIATNSVVTVSLVSYQRGWLHSSAVHRVTLRADPSVHFDIHHAIRHLPDPAKGYVVIDSTPRWPEKVQAAADYYFGNQPALAVQTTFRFDNTTAMTVASPGFSKPLLTQPGVTLAWGGATGTLSVAQAERLTAELRMPRLALNGSGMSMGWTGMQLGADWNTAGTQLDWTGQTVLAIAEVAFATPLGSGTLKGIETRAVQRSQGQSLSLGYVLKVGEAATTFAGAQPQAYRQAVLDLEFDRLDKKALAKYFDDLSGAERARLAPEAYQRLAGQLALGAVRELLKGSPEIRIKHVGVQTGNGVIGGSATLGFDGQGFGAEIDGKAAEPKTWLARVRLEASAELSGTLLRDWMAQDARGRALEALARQGGGTEEAKLHLLAEELAQEQIAALEAEGLLKAQGEKFTLDAQLKEGRLTINGIARDHMLPATLPPLLPAEEDVGSRV